MKYIFCNIIFYMAILTLIVLPSLTYAAPITFESYLETIDIGKNSVYQTIEIIANFREKQNNISFFLVPKIENLTISLDDKKIKCVIEEIVGSSVIKCDFQDYITIGKHFFSIEFNSDYPLINLKDRLMFKSDYNPIIKTDKFIYILKLPVGDIVSESRLITPDPTKIYSDGQRIILFWEKYKLNEKFDVSVIYQAIAPTFNFIYIIAGSFIVLVFIFFILYLRKSSKKNIIKTKSSEKKKKKKDIEEYLVDSEKRVINKLKNIEKNELWQKQLQIKTGFSKAKLSRVIRNLEARNLIKKIPFGNTNKIKLKKI